MLDVRKGRRRLSWCWGSLVENTAGLEGKKGQLLYVCCVSSIVCIVRINAVCGS
jgi:hypothetical protein